MIKEAYYFSHDANARNDEKILALRIKYGWEGYGIYWAIIEKMRESTNYMCIKDYNIIAFDLRIDSSVIKSIVEDFRLFVFTDCGKYFYSKRLNATMEFKEYKSKKASESASKRWNKPIENHIVDANALHVHSIGNASKEKESKVNESKGEGEKLPHARKVFSESTYFEKEKFLNARPAAASLWSTVPTHAKEILYTEILAWSHNTHAWRDDDGWILEAYKWYSRNPEKYKIKEAKTIPIKSGASDEIKKAREGLKVFQSN